MAPATKRRKVDLDQEFEEIIGAEYEEDLSSILARIKEQEDSEAFARQLESEWNNEPSTSANGSEVVNRVERDVIVIADDDDHEEDDEEMARRLAQEWDEQDSRFSPFHFTSSVLNTEKRRTSIDSLSTPDMNIPPDMKLREHRPLFTQERICPKCNKMVVSPRGLVIFSASVPPLTLLSLLHAPCRACKTNYCRGCFSEVSCPVFCMGKDKTCVIRSCCAEGRAIAVFEALGELDRQYIKERSTSHSRVMAAEKRNKSMRSASNSVGPGGTGYGTGHSLTSMGATRGKRKLKDQSTMSNAPIFDWLVAGLTTLTSLLPEPYAENAKVYDMLPHASIGHLISVSYLPEILSTLLRNDSVTDWVERSDTYHAMIVLLRRMVDCELTVECLIQQRWEKSKSCGLEEWMWGDGEITWEMEINKHGQRSSTFARDPPLYDNFKRLNKQCEAFLAGASQMMADGDRNDEDIEEIVQATSLCGDITSARDDIERAVVALGRLPSNYTDSNDILENHSKVDMRRTKGKGKSRDPAVDMEKDYALECERLAFRHVDTLSDDGQNGFGRDYAYYNYAGQLKQTASATRNPKDRLHLIKELAVMATCLPPGVWVRVDEVRHDAIKFMIAGPDDTPYAGGLFEFDCFMPIDYPHNPPLIHLRTTGRGGVRFNPNLYNCGKVCLSLLGTWPGQPEEQWSPKSTLLQVIVSIQSMIFVDAPYFNEPGHGKANPTQPASIMYNRNIALQTVRWAIVDWLKDDHRGGLWKDVIVSHFTIRNDRIRKCIHKWAANDLQMKKYLPTGGDGYSSTRMGGSCQYDGLQHVTALNLLDEYDNGIAIVQRWGKRA